MEEEDQGAALPSVVASPSRADWAGGQLSAFPDGSEPSAGLWPAREEAAKKTKTVKVKLPHSTTIPPSSPSFPSTSPPPSTQSSGS